jgi:hypothetical protein
VSGILLIRDLAVVQSGAVPPAFYPVAVGASLLTSLAAPLLTTRAETLKVPPGSTMAGGSLIELDLIRRFGVQIGRTRRNQERRLAPGGHDTLEAGDELLVLGTHQQIQEFAATLNRDPQSQFSILKSQISNLKSEI